KISVTNLIIKRTRGRDEEGDIAYLIRRTVEDLPEELHLHLQQLHPKELARVVLLDWVDRIIAERSDNKEDSSSHATLCTLLGLYPIASTYPEKLRRVVKESMKKQMEGMKRLGEMNKMLMNISSEIGKENEAMMHKMKLRMALYKYMDEWKTAAFMAHMLPAPPSVKPDPSLEYPEWAALIKSLDMTKEMRQFISDPSQVHDEIAAILYRNEYTVKGMKKHEKHPVSSMDANGDEERMGDHNSMLAEQSLWMWLRRVTLKAKEEGNKQEESRGNEYAPSTIAALLFMEVASNSFSP
ncbi:hypothetical protein PMAYCL1PPCAC_24583, partial [Pristionchus mayeri]